MNQINKNKKNRINRLDFIHLHQIEKYIDKKKLVMKHKLVVYHLFWSAVILTTIKFYQAEEIENVETLWEEFKLVNAKAYGNLEEEFNRLNLKYCLSPTLLIRNIILFI